MRRQKTGNRCWSSGAWWVVHWPCQSLVQFLWSTLLGIPTGCKQVHNKKSDDGRFPNLYTKTPLFQGGQTLEPKQLLVAGEICSRRENCWQRISPATRCRCGGATILPQECEDVAVCGGVGSRDRLVLASNFCPNTIFTL